MAGPDFLAKSRALAKIALAGSLGLVVMVVLLPFLIDHTTVSEGLILVWAIFLLLTAIILGVALAYVFMTGGGRGAGGAAAGGGAPPPARAHPGRGPRVRLHDGRGSGARRVARGRGRSAAVLRGRPPDGSPGGSGSLRAGPCPAPSLGRRGEPPPTDPRRRRHRAPEGSRRGRAVPGAAGQPDPGP